MTLLFKTNFSSHLPLFYERQTVTGTGSGDNMCNSRVGDLQPSPYFKEKSIFKKAERVKSLIDLNVDRPLSQSV